MQSTDVQCSLGHICMRVSRRFLPDMELALEGTDVDDMCVLRCRLLPMMVPSGINLMAPIAGRWRQMFPCLLA